MPVILLIAFATLLVFLIGVLTGNGYTTYAQDARDRQLAAKTRWLNEEQRRLGEQGEL